MPPKRALRDAVEDPLARKSQKGSAAAIDDKTKAPRREVGFWPTMAALAVGLLGGVLIGRFFRWR
ncbi:MAG: hypothetical protein PVH30_04380 [Desulfobacterales bacterium]|jgi:hypothetical protein